MFARSDGRACGWAYLNLEMGITWITIPELDAYHEQHKGEPEARMGRLKANSDRIKPPNGNAHPV